MASAVAPTRDRLLDAGMRLFAERGFRATTVGAVEAAAGLQPRRGALYRHFESKEALLQAGVRRHLDDTATGAAQLTSLTNAGVPEPEVVRTVLLLSGRWFLDELDRQRSLMHVFERDHERVAAMADEVRRDVIDAGHRTAATLLAALAPDLPDPEATAVLLLNALVAHRRTEWTFGATPLQVDDERALAAWVDLALGIAGIGDR